MTPEQQQQRAAIVERLHAGLSPLEVCLELGCGMAEVTMLAGKYKITPRPAPGEGNKGRPRELDKHHYMMAVLDKASSDKAMRPLPERFETTGADGQPVVLSVPRQQPRR